jgi:hypothetical protein
VTPPSGPKKCVVLLVAESSIVLTIECDPTHFDYVPIRVHVGSPAVSCTTVITCLDFNKAEPLILRISKFENSLKKNRLRGVYDQRN